MKVTIFSRLTIGYISMFLVIGAVNAYALLKLHRLGTDTARIFNVDARILDLQRKLADSILSQMGYEKKYIITKDHNFYDQFTTAKDDFNKYLTETIDLADTSSKREALNRIRNAHDRYVALIHEEEEQVAGNRSYRKSVYEPEKGGLVEEILVQLKVLEQTSRRDIYDRMNTLREVAITSRELTIYMSIVALILVIGISFVTTRNITKPLTLLAEKTKEISAGVFRGDLTINSPPEIAELTTAFNVMCDKLKRVERMKSDFFSSMSHELRTPLTSIKEGIGLLQDGVGGSVSDKQKRLLSILSEETYRLIGLVNSLLDLSKMEEGMMTYDFHDEYLSPLVKRVVIEMGPLVEAKKIQLKTEINDGLPTLKLDRERIFQVLRNLIGNAVKFTPEGGTITIRTWHNNQGAEFSVRDTGPGIPKENLKAIFEKFNQLPVKASEWMKGTGLGLAIVKHIVTAHGGTVWAESEPGQGSAFIFILPF
jgi:two-component system, NtrC family, sensor histidine kinase GlrK